MTTKFMAVLMVLIFGFCFMAFGQDATPSPMPSASPLPLDGVSAFIAGLTAWLDGKMAAIGTALGFIWVVVSKLVSTEKSKGIVDLMQRWLDGVAKLIMVFGTLLQKISALLADMVRSDGILGKK